MKKVFLSSLLLPLTLLSAETSVSLERGMKYYTDKQYENSYEIFSKIYLDHLSNANFNFYFGKSAYETGDYQTALAAFERVEMQDSSNIQNRLEMARTYYMLNMFEDAQYAYEDVLANPNLPENVRKNIELSLAKVQRIQKKSFTYASGMVDVVYDSNVNYGSIDDYEYSGVTLQKNKSLDDVAIQAFANITNVYDVGSKNGFAIKNRLTAYNKSYLGMDNYNILYFSYFPSLLYKETKYTAEIAVGLDTLYLADEEYINSISVVPSFQYTFNPTLNFFSHLKYQQKEFQQIALNDLDANRLELSLGVQNILTPRSYLLTKLYAINESKVRGQALNVDFNEYKTNVTYVNQFSSDFTASLFAQAKLRDYDQFSTGYGSTRKDWGANTNLTINYSLFPSLIMSLKTNYEYIDSNQDYFSYHKYILSIGLVKTF